MNKLLLILCLIPSLLIGQSDYTDGRFNIFDTIKIENEMRQENPSEWISIDANLVNYEYYLLAYSKYPGNEKAIAAYVKLMQNSVKFLNSVKSETSPYHDFADFVDDAKEAHPDDPYQQLLYFKKLVKESSKSWFNR